MKKTLYKVLVLLSKILIPALFVIFLIMYSINPLFYMFVTGEDRVLEWLTVVLFVLTGVIALIIAIRIRSNKLPYFWFYLIVSILFVLFSLEELSWGQRLIGVESPEFFLDNNDQGEINIHNVIQQWGKDLSIFGITYDFKTKHVTGLFLFFYGSILPIIAISHKISDFFRRIQFVVPPLILSFSFFLAAILMIDKPTGQEEEIGEFFFSICLFLFIAMEYLKLDRKLAE